MGRCCKRYEPNATTPLSSQDSQRCEQLHGLEIIIVGKLGDIDHKGFLCYTTDAKWMISLSELVLMISSSSYRYNDLPSSLMISLDIDTHWKNRESTILSSTFPRAYVVENMEHALDAGDVMVNMRLKAIKKILRTWSTVRKHGEQGA